MDDIDIVTFDNCLWQHKKDFLIFFKHLLNCMSMQLNSRIKWDRQKVYMGDMFTLGRGRT